jgi:hypothetical protein
MFLKRDYVTKRSIGARQTIVISDVDSCNFKNKDVLLNAQMHVVPVFLGGEVTYEDWIRPASRIEPNSSINFWLITSVRMISLAWT